ncbi:MAG TPA: maltotransferase domain-containing protein [Stellaceae bacterium]|nr:maltotransferase domain-containing protein [Stellaceae bacterium]
MAEGLRIYNLFPTLAGPIRRWAEHLPRISAMAFNAVYLNPFHYPGFSGSLYAVKDYYRLNPRLRGSAKASDEALLRDFTSAAGRLGLRVIMDLVVNHTAKDSELLAERPEWFARDEKGALVSPYAPNPEDDTRRTVWGDLAEIDYERPQRGEIVAYFERVVRHYVGLGFGGFRCDAAYKVPADVWQRLIGAAKEISPDVVFLAETLGAPPEAVTALRPAGFDYLFNSVKWWDYESPWLLEQYERYRRIAPSIGFPESHDTERLVTELLAAGFPEAEIAPRYRQAYAFAAAFSAGVVMPMGYEFGWARRLNVVSTKPEDREPPRFDISADIAAINRAKRAVPALNEEGPQRRLTPPDDPLVALLRQSENALERAFVLVNTHEREVRTVDCRALLDGANLGHLGERLQLSEICADGEEAARAPRVTIGPLDVRVLRARMRPVRQVSPTRPRTAPAKPVHHPAWRADARIVIENIDPEIDAGRYPAKRIVGEEIVVFADVFRDGHDKIAGALKFAFEDGEWRETPLAYFDNDRWVGRFTPDQVGRWRFTLEAWTDHFASWRDDFLKKREAGQRVDLELMEGRQLIEHALHGAAAPLDERLGQFVRSLGRADADGQMELLLSEELAALMAEADERGDAVRYARELEITVDRPEAVFSAWYEMFARSQGREQNRSATFDDCIARLDEIAALGFDVVYLPPIHPIGGVNRKGRNNNPVAAPDDPGSPYAIGSDEGGHCSVHPELGTLADFRRFVAAAAALGMEVALDFAIQCAPDHPWVKEHREWFRFRPDGTLKYAENPPKKYEDIVNVDFYNPDRQGLWNELRDAVLFWIEQGVTIFRVDNPHTKPLPFWEWLIREVKARCPEAIFLSEAFTRPKMMWALAKAGFTQSYTYFTWRNTKDELTEYLTELTQRRTRDYLRPNFFTNTPDILPVFLQEGGRPAFLIRLVLAATLSPAYGIYNGFELCENTPLPGREEYLDSEKYQYKVWDWDRPGNIKHEIAVINRVRRENPALQRLTTLRFIFCDDPNIIAYVKATDDRSNIVVIAVNLDPHGVHAGNIVLPLVDLEIPNDRDFAVEELLTGRRETWRGDRRYIWLDPAQTPAVLFRIEDMPR